MTYRRSLRARLILSYPLLGAVVGLLLTGLLFFGLESFERELMDAYLLGDLQHFMLNGNGASQVRTAHWVAYRTPIGEGPPGFEHLAGLTTGLHEIDSEGREYDIGIAEQAGERFYLLFDDTLLEKYEQFIIILLAAIFLVNTFATIWLGFWLAGRVIRPIKDLAQQVKVIKPEEGSEPLASSFADDEVGDLAAAFDAYQDRLAAFVTREREFTADASHELRGPLAVIQATAEGMLANRALPVHFLPKVERIMRTAETMAGTLGVLLLLAREKDQDPLLDDRTDLAAELKRVVADQRENLTGRPISLDLELRARPELMTPPAAAVMVADNLLRNALAYTVEGRVAVVLEKDRLLVEDTGPGIAPGDLHQIFERGKRGSNINAFGRGLGLAIASRLCDRFGWSLSLENISSGGVRAEWRFR